MRGFCLLVAWCVCTLFASPTSAVVFINEIFINPSGTTDETAEYIELLGTPGKKLDGYAVAQANGCQGRFYPANTLPPPDCFHEIDEFFSLDGLSLGANGMLVIAIGNIGDYAEVLDDANFFGPWVDIWNGSAEDPGRLQNDGSNTIFLIRNRPGQTEANPVGPIRWGKDVFHDAQLIRPAMDNQSGEIVDQWGDGNLDMGEDNGLGGITRDLLGATTRDMIDDDLEIVDEISYEQDRGFEYDVDSRDVDSGSTVPGLPERRVHALDDPQGFNPDCLTRVDYRTKGEGWPPADGGVGELPNGNNWQDTATEQWIRGESLLDFGPLGFAYFYSNAPNENEDSIQPFETNVPLWLADGEGDDFDFASAGSYPIEAGRLNLLAIPFIPGDTDRDGDCDEEDIAKVLSVFGDADWVFSNAFDEADNDKDGDPAEQIRPWDVDGSGDNGIDPTDLQWALNFQGDTTGQIVGVQYENTTPTSRGVVLNDNVGVTCVVDVLATVQSGRPLTGLREGDLVDLNVTVAVESGANVNAGEENGVMQVMHDLLVNASDVLTIEEIEFEAPFVVARDELVELTNEDESRSANRINAYTTAFDSGLAGPASVYRVTLRANAIGTADLLLSATTDERLSLAIPHGVKIGHTATFGDAFSLGDPETTNYPDAIAVSVTEALGNCTGTPAIGLGDFGCFAVCTSMPESGDTDCTLFDFDGNEEVNILDFAEFQRRFTGE